MNAVTKARIGVIGLGRIGKIHLKNLVENIDGAEVLAAVSPSESSQQFARDLKVAQVSSNAESIFSNADIDAVVICSPTSSHAEYIERSLSAGKAIFCEKPIDLSLGRVREVVETVEAAGSSMMIGFNQRFDKDFSSVKERIVRGEIGSLRLIKITSRDPSPPPISYIKSSGGLFHDMTIHDFDMARFLAGSEVVEVYASGANLIDPAIGEAGDIDTGVIILEFENGCKGVIENSREASYGYDQRVEVLGSKGMIQAGNQTKNDVQMYNDEGVRGGRLLDFFMDRYEDSYCLEMEVFIKSVLNKSDPPVTMVDGLKASVIAEAANKSMELKRPVTIHEISNE